MHVTLLSTAEEFQAYDTFVKSHPHGSLWQSLEWKKYQEAMGREVRIYRDSDASALVVIDRTVGGFSTWDSPRGPLGLIENEKLKIDNLMSHIVSDAKKEKCMNIFFSPKIAPIINYQLSIINSARHEQPSATRILDLTLSEDALLAQMHQKGRYNIKVAEKNGVTVQESKDIDAYYELAKKTAGRDGFGIPSKKQLQAFIEKLPGSFLLLAYSKLARPAAFGRETRPPGRVRTGNSKPIAGIIGIIWGNTGIYYYGASDYEHRNLMAPYLLQWEAIKRCKAAGCTRYDLLGIAPQATSAELRATSNDISRSSKLEARSPHPWAGISDFKAKFGGTVITYPPEQEIVLKPIIRTILLAKRAIIG